MSAPTYQTAPIICPNCSNRFATPVLAIIDVGQDPDLKTLFLSGQLNIAVCPQCGHGGMLSTPLVYHDPEKELLFTFVPTELGSSGTEQERIIGDLTNRVISALPPEQRKGYLLRPRSFLRLEGMLEAILEADGITPEMMEAQRAKAELLERLLGASGDETRRIIAQENDTQIDYEFFQLLAVNIELAQTAGNAEAAQQLLALRQQLLDWTTQGREVADREQVIKSLGTEITREELLDKLVEAALADEQVKVETMVAVARPVIDYTFYQQLTSRMEAATEAGNAEQARTLEALRDTILDLTAEIDAEMQQATAQAAQRLQQILQSADVEEAVRANLPRIDELFLNVLAANLQAAEEAGRVEDAAKLEQIGNLIMKLLQESQPPEIQFINQLLTTDYPGGTQALLEENRSLVNAQLLEIMHVVGEDLTQNGRIELGQRLAQIREQAAAMVT
ncbi:CpXC domain-containing protein [Chloroflexota bacterium]